MAQDSYLPLLDKGPPPDVLPAPGRNTSLCWLSEGKE
jgi:hypothetical protein